MTKQENFLGGLPFGPSCSEIHLGTVSRVVRTSFETWVTSFALRGFWRRVVFRFRILTVDASNSTGRLLKLRLIHMYLATESGRSERGPFVIDNYLYDCFH